MTVILKKKFVFIFVVLCTMVFASCASQKTGETVSIEGTAWVFTAFVENTCITVIQNDNRFKNLAQKPEINFGSTGVFSGTTGVNRLTASWTLDTGTNELRISPAALTRMMALSEDAALLETIFVNLLQGVSSYSVKGDELTLLDSGKAPLLVFTRSND
jgi:heat shock protein HslJ